MILARIVKFCMKDGLHQNCTFLNMWRKSVKDHLTVEMFETMMTGKSMKIEMPRDFKRIHVNRNSKQNDVDNFSILQLDVLVKHINTVPWKGRYFFEKGSVPLYHNSLQ